MEDNDEDEVENEVQMCNEEAPGEVEPDLVSEEEIWRSTRETSQPTRLNLSIGRYYLHTIKSTQIMELMEVKWVPTLEAIGKKPAPTSNPKLDTKWVSNLKDISSTFQTKFIII